MVYSLFTSDIFLKGILPFLLVFVLVFAILQRSKIFGEGKSQIDALIALSIALILIAFPGPRDYIVSMIPWLAMALVILLIFLLIYGFVGETDKDTGLKLPSWIKPTVSTLAIVFVVVLVLKTTNYWNTFYNWITSSNVLSNIFMIVVVIVVLVIALKPEFKVSEYKLNG